MKFSQIKRALKKVRSAGPNQAHAVLEMSESAKMAPFFTQFYREYGAERVANPYHHAHLLFDLYKKTPASAEKIKDASSEGDSTKRFLRSVDEIRKGDSPLSAIDAKSILETTDVLNGNTRQFPEFGADAGWHFRAASSFAPKGRLLFNIVRYNLSQNLLEVGTAYGMSAMFMMLANSRYVAGGHLTTIEPWEPQYSTSKAILEKEFGKSVSCNCGYSTDIIPELTRRNFTCDLFFHDGGHSGENYVRDFNAIKDSLNEGAVVIIDDIRWHNPSIDSEDPKCYEGWRQIVADQRVSVAYEVNQSVGLALVQ